MTSLDVRVAASYDGGDASSLDDPRQPSSIPSLNCQAAMRQHLWCAIELCEAIQM